MSMRHLPLIILWLFCCVRCFSAEGDGPGKPINRGKELGAAIGERVSVTGIAENSKLCAHVVGDDFAIGPPEIAEWPKDTIRKQVIVVGWLSIRDYGEPSKLKAKPAGKHYELREVRWRLTVSESESAKQLTIQGKEPAKGDAKQIDIGGDVSLEIVFIPPGEFRMGSTAEEKAWAVGQDGGALFSSGGGAREAYEGESRPMRVKEGFWMGRTEVTVGQFRRFADETGYASDAEKQEGAAMCFDQNWKPNFTHSGSPPHPWMDMKDKSWRDPNHGVPQQEDFPVVCVSYNDMLAFCEWLTNKQQAAGELPEGMVYRLPTEAEWEYACRGGSKESHYFWWGSNLEDAKGRLNISGLDLLPGKDHAWPGAKLPWLDGYAMVSPVDYYGERGRNGFGLADMCGGVWEFVLDHFDPTGGHEEVFYENPEQRMVTRPVCKGGNFYDVPGNARCAVRLGIQSMTYSDSRDGFRVCLGAPR